MRSRLDHAGASRARETVALLLGILAFAAVLQITDPPAPGLDPDAASYLGAAESLVDRRGFRVPTADWWNADSTQPLTHFPPGLSTAIALPTTLGMAPVQASRLVNALAAFVTLATLVLLVIDATSVAVGAVAGLVVLVMPSMYEVHASVLSEPLFLACAALALSAMVRRPASPLTSGIPAALGLMARYVGVSLVLSVAVWTAAQPAPMPVRLRRALTSVLPAVVLQGSWVLWRRYVAATASIRTLALYGDLRLTITQGFQTIEAWLVPDPGVWSWSLRHHRLLAVITLATAALVVGKGALMLHAWPTTAPTTEREACTVRAERLLQAGSLMTVLYLAVVVVARLVADPLIPFDQRMLAPVFLLATILFVVCLFHWWRSTASALPRTALAGALLIWCVATTLVTWRQHRHVRAFGSDIDTPRWARSELIAFARAEGASHPLYANQPAAVYLHLHRPARGVPGLEESHRMEEFADTVRAHDGRVLMFNPSGGASRRIDALRRVQGLRVVLDGPTGVVFAPAFREPRPALPSTAARPSPRR